ncbi:hypothetical protein D9M68_776380 [compost metagenome]
MADWKWAKQACDSRLGNCMPPTSNSRVALRKPASRKASTAGLISGINCAAPSTYSGSCSSFLRLCGANRFSAMLRAVPMAASKVSRLWSAKRSRWVRASASSTS